jgi:ribosomal protein S18 acetylase RimI-like enzyme
MEIHIRKAGIEDLDKVIGLAVEMVSHSVSPMRDVPMESIRRYRRDDLESLKHSFPNDSTAIFIAEDQDGGFLGHLLVMAGYIESSTGEPQAWIFDLSVKEEVSSRGVGRALVKRAEEFAAEKGMKYIGLGVTTSNQRAIRFYEKLGYQEERKRMLKNL